jgi:hypothetical protein
MNAVKAESGVHPSAKVIPGRNVTILGPHGMISLPVPLPSGTGTFSSPDGKGLGEGDPQATKKESRVRLIKNGDLVTGIEIRCACGEVIHLDCEY